jgi:hypothetical protein
LKLFNGKIHALFGKIETSMAKLTHFSAKLKLLCQNYGHNWYCCLLEKFNLPTFTKMANFCKNMEENSKNAIITMNNPQSLKPRFIPRYIYNYLHICTKLEFQVVIRAVGILSTKTCSLRSQDNRRPFPAMQGL